MKKLEIISATLFVIALLLKIFQISGASLLLILSLLPLAVLYSYFAFALLNNIPLKAIFKKDAYAHTTVNRIIGSVLLGFSLSIGVLGLLFTIQFYPGASFAMLIGTITLSIGLIFILIFYRKNKWQSLFYENILKRTVVILLLSVILFSIQTNTLIDLFYWRYPEQGEYVKEMLQEREQNQLQEFNSNNE